MGGGVGGVNGCARVRARVLAAVPHQAPQATLAYVKVGRWLWCGRCDRQRAGFHGSGLWARCWLLCHIRPLWRSPECV